MLLYPTSRLLKPSGTYVAVKDVKPDTRVISGTGTVCTVESIRPVVCNVKDFNKMQHRMWPGMSYIHSSSKIMLNNSCVSSNLLNPSKDQISLPKALKWENNDIDHSCAYSYNMGYVFGAFYASSMYTCVKAGEPIKIRTKSEILATRIINCLSDVFPDTEHRLESNNTVVISERYLHMFKPLSKQSEFPEVYARTYDKQYCAGLFQGIVDYTKSTNTVHPGAFRIASLALFISGKLNKTSWSQNDDYLTVPVTHYTNMRQHKHKTNEIPRQVSPPACDVIHAKHVTFSTTRGIIINNTIVI